MKKKLLTALSLTAVVILAIFIYRRPSPLQTAEDASLASEKIQPAPNSETTSPPTKAKSSEAAPATNEAPTTTQITSIPVDSENMGLGEYSDRDLSVAEGIERRAQLIKRYREEQKRIISELTEAQIGAFRPYQRATLEKRNSLMEKIQETSDPRLEKKLVEELNELDRGYAQAKRQLYGDQNALILQRLSEEDRQVIETYFDDDEQEGLLPFPEFML